ncbi:hypothetical protein RN001_002321 [Aquatica leii]|uniref:Cytochrome P450 n=1 Tax=Aquatica leii TaxID=1421715 RepID=A0AAN7SST6_9COLE|nr:hypothetical protein RN001_002321 [Aquatica leii]
MRSVLLYMMLRIPRANPVLYTFRKCSTDTAKTNSSDTSRIFPEESTINRKPASLSTPHVAKKENLFLKLEQLESVPETEALRKSLSFDEVPGPKYLKYLSKFWSFFPVMGTQVTASTVQYLLSAGKVYGNHLSWGNNAQFFRKMLDHYGPVVRLHGPFGGDVVILSKPEHVAAVFESEGRYPVRSCLDCLEKYRVQYRRFRRVGPFLMYGLEWENLRKAIAGSLQTLTEYQFELIDKTTDEFITRILRIRNKQDEVPSYFGNEINKWALECMCCITLNKRLGFLDSCGLSNTSEPARMLESLNNATNAIRRCESGIHLWKFFNTPAWNSLVKHCDQLGLILNKYIYKIQDSLHQKKINNEILSSEKTSLVESLFLRDGLLPEDILTIILDMVLIGVNTVSHSIAFLLYNLARNPRAQAKLYKEVVDKHDLLLKDHSLPFSYLQACIKESLRLNPPMPILSRVLSKDTLVHNYRLPRGTYVLIDTHISSMREEYFEDAHRFKPERWFEEAANFHENNYVTMPFGFGQKSCIARVVAETQIALIMIKIIEKFRVEYHYGELTSTNRPLAAPDHSLKFTFVDRI